MPERTRHAPGTFCWPEAMTADLEKGKSFYAALLGWDLLPTPGGYTLAQRKGKSVAGIFALSAEQKKQGVPPHWMSYVRVASADDSAAKAASLGGKVLAPAFDVPGVGRMAVIADPGGATFALWEAKGMEGVQLLDEPGAPTWFELMTRDAARASLFYVGLFEWRIEQIPMKEGIYTVFRGTESACGMMEMSGPKWGTLPPHWMPYFAVEDADAVAKECTRLGGRVIHPPTDVPNVGRFSILAAPDGAAFSIVKAGA